MSAQRTQHINCPHCNAPQEFTWYASINVTIDPSLKTQLLDGTLNKSPCKKCGQPIQLVTPLIYHDMQRRLMIHCNLAEKPEDEDPGTAAMMEKLRQDDGYIIRTVYSHPALRECVLIMDAGMNDEVIESIKAPLLEGIQTRLNSDGRHTIHFHFDSYEKRLLGSRLNFLLFTHPSQLMTLSVPLKNLTRDQKTALMDQDILRIR